MSGVKGRSGRKPDPVVKSCRAAIESCITPAQWRKIWKALAAAAADGNVQAARLLHEYSYGRPRPEPEPVSASEDKSARIAYYLPIRDDEVLPPDALIVKQSDIDSLSHSED